MSRKNCRDINFKLLISYLDNFLQVDSNLYNFFLFSPTIEKAWRPGCEGL